MYCVTSVCDTRS